MVRGCGLLDRLRFWMRLRLEGHWLRLVVLLLILLFGLICLFGTFHVLAELGHAIHESVDAVL